MGFNSGFKGLIRMYEDAWTYQPYIYFHNYRLADHLEGL